MFQDTSAGLTSGAAIIASDSLNNAETQDKPHSNVFQSLGGAVHILVAEDNRVNQLVVSGILNELKVSYKIVQNGQEAFDAFCRDAGMDAYCSKPFKPQRLVELIAEWRKR